MEKTTSISHFDGHEKTIPKSIMKSEAKQWPKLQIGQADLGLVTC